MESRDKAIRLFEYLNKLSALNRKKIKRIEDENWCISFREIKNMGAQYISLVEDVSDNQECSYYMEIKKPSYDANIDFLTSDVQFNVDNYHPQDFMSEPHFISLEAYLEKNNIKLDNEKIEKHREKYKTLQNKYDDWYVKWKLWAKKQREKKKICDLFETLYFKRQELENNSETIEFVVANGMMKIPGSDEIHYPVLLRKVNLEFDSIKNIIRVCDAEAQTEFYSAMLEDLTYVNPSVLKDTLEDVKERDYNPLNKSLVNNFIKSFVHSLSSKGDFVENISEIDESYNDIVAYNDPVFLIRKKTDGLFKALQLIIQNLNNGGEVPKHILDLIGDGSSEEFVEKEYSFEEELAAISGESLDILLSKEANKEQLEIAENIESQNAVLVQGPPGTGKTHTIANLLGHFLAEGKNVLVTSQTKKALTVLKDKVSEEIKDLCVTVLDDSNADMERSISGITDKSTRSASSYMKKADELKEERVLLLDELYKVRSKIYNLKLNEFNQIVYEGDSYSPEDIAKYVNENRSELSYIPGNIAPNVSMPLTYDELTTLYKTSEQVTKEEEEYLDSHLICPDSLLSPIDFKKIILEKNAVADCLEKDEYSDFTIKKSNVLVRINGTSISLVDLMKLNTEMVESLKNKVQSFPDFHNWELQVIADGIDSGNKIKKWELLENAVDEYAGQCEKSELALLGKEVQLPSLNLSDMKSNLHTVRDIFAKKGKIGLLDLKLHKNVSNTMETVLISNNKLQSKEDCNLVLDYIELIETKDRLKTIWNAMFRDFDSMRFELFEDDADVKCPKVSDTISICLNWYKDNMQPFLNELRDSGFNVKELFEKDNLMDDTVVSLKKKLNVIENILPVSFDFIQNELKFKELNDKLEKNKLNLDSKSAHPLLMKLNESYVTENVDDYSSTYDSYVAFYRKNNILLERKDLLNKLEKAAPIWASKIRNREYLNTDHTVPESIHEAWKWKQFAQIISDLNKESINELDQKAYQLSKELHKKTSELASNLAWYHLVKRTEANISMKQDLANWQLTMRKIGKGTGKRAPLLRKQARELMARCQKAVPAWIMPMSTALTTLDPSSNKFDIVIVDEASQSDVSSLAILYMAKKVIIVGDDKQVSPMSIGSEVDKIRNLQDTYIKDVIPGYTNYDGNTSLYDIAKTTFKSLMLREHFRCVPEIIGFSNKLSYDYKIKPLRDDSECIIRPFVIPYRVQDGVREGKKNYSEAIHIVALMKACMEQKEYKDQSFGVISLLGDEQVKLIQQTLFKYLETKDIEDRHILVGNAYGFQGDERDVMFLSMVDSNEGHDGTLRKTSNDHESTKQRYNVAASRARNQLWIVHSLDYANDLKSDDIRRDLLEYAENPKLYLNSVRKIEQESESVFEEGVAKALVARGYHIVQQWEVGAYRIDMVALYKNKRIAIECDGERWHSGEQNIKEDMERQAILERMGWRFVRIRGSQYFSDPDGSIDYLEKKINELGIYPEEVDDKGIVHQDKTKLQMRVYARADELLREWEPEKFGEEVTE